jgi:LysM repeat protein
MVFTVALLVGLAALALAKGVSVLAEDRTTTGGQPRQTVPAPAAQATERVQGARAVESVAPSPESSTPAPAPTPVAPGGTNYHSVQQGDTLGKIALKYGVTTTALSNANGITNPDLIRVGQRLIIPAH